MPGTLPLHGSEELEVQRFPTEAWSPGSGGGEGWAREAQLLTQKRPQRLAVVLLTAVQQTHRGDLFVHHLLFLQEPPSPEIGSVHELRWLNALPFFLGFGKSGC